MTDQATRSPVLAVADRVPRALRRISIADPRSIARRRRLVAVARAGLPVAALLVLALLAVWPELDGAEDSLRVTYRRGEAIPTDQTRVLDARLTGVDEAGRPYTVTASEARQRPGEDLVRLTDPRGDLTLSSGAWLLVEAKQGSLWQKEGRLVLTEGVELWHDAGWHVETETAQVDLRAKSASGNDPVEVRGPLGQLEAVGFEIRDAGAVVLFHGPAHALLHAAEKRP